MKTFAKENNQALNSVKIKNRFHLCTIYGEKNEAILTDTYTEREGTV